MTVAAKDYRPDIDGLRAVAVLPVILFHFGVAAIGGGFVGVDVFFVISGFLITQIIVRDIEQERFSLVRFYERRVRRIIPALLFAMALTLVLGWWLTTPAEYRATATSALSSLAFVSNIYFWSGSGYFDEGAMRPLLHTWSLSVEEQFYILFPIALFLVRKHRGVLLPAILLVFAGSLAVAAYGAYRSPSATFFLIPTRAWELTMGAIVALGMVPSFRSRVTAEVAGLVGLAMILVPVFVYTERTIFPGLGAVPPCLGTALLIHSGKDGRTTAARLLAARPIVFVGLLSYSLYLIHYPIAAYAKRVLPDGAGPAAIAAMIAATFVVSYFSWRWIEQPFRDPRRFSRQQIFTSAGVASLATAAVAALLVVTGGVPQRYTPTELAALAAADDVDATSRRCINRDIEAALTGGDCGLGVADGKVAPSFLLAGDSHAAALAPAFDGLAAAGRLIAFNACPPLLDVASPALSSHDRALCLNRNRQWIERAQSPDISTVYLTGFWSAHLDGLAEGGPDAERRFAAAWDRTLAALTGKNVIVLLDVPVGTRAVPTDLVLARRLGQEPQTLRSGSTDAAARVIRNVTQGRARLIDLSAALCPAMPCPAELGGRPLLTDANHVSASVARDRLRPLIAAVPPTAQVRAP